MIQPTDREWAKMGAAERVTYGRYRHAGLTPPAPYLDVRLSSAQRQETRLADMRALAKATKRTGR